MATQALLLSCDVEKNPGPSQERRQAPIIKCDHCQKRIRCMEPKEHFMCQLYGMFSLKVCLPEISGEQLAMQ